MNTQDIADQQSTTNPPRLNFYAAIHKAIRMFMCDTLVAAGSMDCSDPASVATVLAQVRSLAEACAAHIHHENEFVHTAMELRSPGSSAQIASEHEHHGAAIAMLLALADEVESAAGAARVAAAGRLYRYLAVFVGENFVHMNVEETEHNAVLWATHTDDELLAIHDAILASIPPAETMATMHWMIPAVDADERREILSGIRAQAPAPVFDALLSVAQGRLAAREWDKLQHAFGLQERAAA